MSEQPIRVGDVPDPMTHAHTITPQPEPQAAPPGIDLYAPPTPEELAGKSPLQALEDALSEDVEPVDLVTLRVPRRRGIKLTFDPSRINKDNRKAWQKRSTKKSRRAGVDDEVDDFLFACLVLANTHVGTLVNDREARDTEGTPLTFAHAQLWQMVKARDPQECIEKLFANDQHVSAASGEVLLSSGFDDDLTADPTQG